MDLHNFIGKKLEDVCLILDQEGKKYIVKETVGYKDTEILNESYVVRCLSENNSITLTTGRFKTNI